MDPSDIERLAGLVADRIAEKMAAGRFAAAQRFLTVADAARYTGLSTDSVRSMISTGRVTALRPVKGRVLIDRRELEAAVLASTNAPRNGRGKYVRLLIPE
jgi:excisionase family DNA binding protein